MTEIFRDTIWQFIGVFFGIVAIIVSVIIYRLQQAKKYLSYQVLSETSLLNVDKEVEQKIQILFEGNPVQTVYLLLIKFINSGNIPILPTDYLKAVNVVFNERCKILSAEILEKEPKSIDVTAKTENTRISLTPTLLNSDDFFVLKILVSEFDGDVEVEGRIIGVKKINKGLPKISIGSSIIVILGLIMMTIGAILVFIFMNLIYLGLSLLGTLLIFFPIIFDSQYKSIMDTPFETIIEVVRKRK